MNRRLLLMISALSSVPLLAAAAALLDRPEPAPVAEAPQAAPAVDLQPDVMVVEVPIVPGATLGELLVDRGVPALAVREAALEHHDLAKIRPDRTLALVYADGELDPVALRYGVDEDHTVVVARAQGGWAAHIEEVVYEASVGTVSFDLTRSLWLDGLDAGLRPAELVRLAEIFEYEVDFNSELRAGAAFTLVAEVLTAEGRVPKLGVIHAVRLDNDGSRFTAVHHLSSDGTQGFYHPDGQGMRRPFLRSPLEFSRVTSGFDPKRFHPILKRTRPHNGTDFGAPDGTPVRAVADGKVVTAGTRGGHGKFVKLDHEGPYDTSYSHLSRIAVKSGQRVEQGDLIGEVGMTGLATGPHLHYQMWKDGRYVDAMRTELPSSTPLPSSERPAFEAALATWLPHLGE